MRKLEEVLSEHDAAEALISTAKADVAKRKVRIGRRAQDPQDAQDLISLAKTRTAERKVASGRKPLRAQDGVDYRRRVLARLLGLDPRSAHPVNAELWKQANERLDQLGL